MLRRALVLCALSALCAFLPAAAHAQNGIETGIGPRLGVSINPDQIMFGGQAIMGVANDLTFDPSLELGFGDDVTNVQLNFDLHYHFAIQNSEWRPYAGGGLGVAFYSWDGGDDTEVGVNLVLGAGRPTSSGNRFFGELRIGLEDLPDLKMLVGWNFRM